MHYLLTTTHDSDRCEIAFEADDDANAMDAMWLHHHRGCKGEPMPERVTLHRLKIGRVDVDSGLFGTRALGCVFDSADEPEMPEVEDVLAH